VQDLVRFARDANPVSVNLDDLTRSLDRTGGIERVMDYLFFQMIAINGFDGLGHYLRAALIVNLCSSYATSPTAGCNANFTETKAVAAGGGRVDPRLADLREGLRAAIRGGGSEGAARRELRGSVPPTGTLLEQLSAERSDRVAAERRRRMRDLRRRAERPSPGLRGGEPVLDYLLGGER
jgi:hypothetical protein